MQPVECRSQESLLKRLSQLTLGETRNLFQENTSEVQELVGTSLWRETWPLISETLSPGFGLAPEDQKNYRRLLLMAGGKKLAVPWMTGLVYKESKLGAAEEHLLCDT